MGKISPNKRGQEEIVGFALIIIIVAVVLLFFLSFSLKKPQKESIESYEADSFVQSALQYTSGCEVGGKNETVQDLIYGCVDRDYCFIGLEEVSSCEVLNTTLTGILEQSWPIEGNRPVKGYEINITKSNADMLFVEEGNKTSNYKGALQDLPGMIKIVFNVYY